MNQINNDIATIKQLAEIVKVNKATMAIKLDGLTADAYKALLDANFVLVKTIIDKKNSIDGMTLVDWADSYYNKFEQMEKIEALIEELI